MLNIDPKVEFYSSKRYIWQKSALQTQSPEKPRIKSSLWPKNLQTKPLMSSKSSTIKNIRHLHPLSGFHHNYKTHKSWTLTKLKNFFPLTFFSSFHFSEPFQNVKSKKSSKKTIYQFTKQSPWIIDRLDLQKLIFLTYQIQPYSLIFFICAIIVVFRSGISFEYGKSFWKPFFVQINAEFV